MKVCIFSNYCFDNVFGFCLIILTSNVFAVQMQVKDPRFEWTRDKSLVLKEVTHSDQGLYANKLSLGFTYETVHLIVSGVMLYCVCIFF